MSKIAKHCTVKGHVQGVFFRKHTCEKAHELGLTGWVRNTSSGDVECLVCGEEDAVNEFCSWLHIGSPSSKVQGVVIEPADEPHTKEFLIL